MPCALRSDAGRVDAIPVGGILHSGTVAAVVPTTVSVHGLMASGAAAVTC